MQVIEESNSKMGRVLIMMEGLKGFIGLGLELWFKGSGQNRILGFYFVEELVDPIGGCRRLGRYWRVFSSFEIKPSIVDPLIGYSMTTIISLHFCIAKLSSHWPKHWLLLSLHFIRLHGSRNWLLV